MGQLDLPLLVAIVSSAIALALIVITGFERVLGLRKPQVQSPLRIEGLSASLLFDQNVLLDATDGARKLLAAVPGPSPTLDSLVILLEPRFPGLRDAVHHDDPYSQVIEAAGMPGMIAQIDHDPPRLRLTLRSDDHLDGKLQSITLQAMQVELAALRDISELSPHPVWVNDGNHRTIWANRAYLDLADRVTPPDRDAPPQWPPAPVFSDIPDPTPQEEPQTHRQSVTFANGETPTQNFEVCSARTDHGTIHFATDIDALTQAESQAGIFMQTLTRTFADLSTGLAIFDRDRKLAIFNPALLDLTKLPVAFLSNQPSFSAVLDRLRDMGTLPEPRNYTSWRDHVADLERQAAEGSYRDTWALPDGQTYRITGHPHPDGALAFLIEDISAEVSITRAFRAEIQTAHAVIDTLQEAIAVFSPAGTMIMTNAKYDEDWSRASSGLETSNILAELEHWQDQTAPSPFWANLQQQFSQSSGRDGVSAPIGGRDGRQFLCRLRPLPAGNTLVGFTQLAQQYGQDDDPFVLEDQHLHRTNTG